jgi:hypothetical protein
LILKPKGFNVYTTDLGEEGIDLGKIYGHDIVLLRRLSMFLSVNCARSSRARRVAMNLMKQ